MRILAYILLAIGILQLVGAGYNQIHGSIRVLSWHAAYTVTRQANPKEFHDHTVLSWSYGILLLNAGIVVYCINKRLDQTDLSLPDPDHKDSQD